MTGDPTRQELLTRARRLAEDLNLSTLGWRIPSDRLIDDFAAGEHRLRAQEHELTALDRSRAQQGTQRTFSLYALEADPADADLIALLVEPESGGAWRLLLADHG